MAEKVFYELIGGNAPRFAGGEVDENGKAVVKDYREGDVLETDLPLDTMWPAKFVRVDRTDHLTRAQHMRRQLASKNRARTTPPAPMKAPQPAAVEVEEEETEETKTDTRAKAKDADDQLGREDVTNQFEEAKPNKLKVTYVKGQGYTIHDGKKVVNETPLRASTQVHSEIKKYIEE